MVSFAPIFAYTDGDRWRPGIGDPTVMGWVTVGAYLVAGLLCMSTAWRVSGVRPWVKQEGRFWVLLGLGLLFLSVNKQLDLQTWFTLTGKRIALAQGWYEQRRVVQAIFIAGMIAGGASAAYWVWRNMRHAPGPNWVALAGFVFLGCFIVIRAASFHHVDSFLKSGPGNIRMNWILELGGITMLGFAAVKRGRTYAEAFSSTTGELGQRGEKVWPAR